MVERFVRELIFHSLSQKPGSGNDPSGENGLDDYEDSLEGTSDEKFSERELTSGLWASTNSWTTCKGCRGPAVMGDTDRSSFFFGQSGDRVSSDGPVRQARGDPAVCGATWVRSPPGFPKPEGHNMTRFCALYAERDKVSFFLENFGENLPLLLELTHGGVYDTYVEATERREAKNNKSRACFVRFGLGGSIR